MCPIVAAAAEVAGKLVLSRGLTSSFRPRKYYTIPKETLEASLEDVEQLINFFVIEFQRILFAENVIVTIAVGLFTFILSSLTDRVQGVRFLCNCVLAHQVSSALGPLAYCYLDNLSRTIDIH